MAVGIRVIGLLVSNEGQTPDAMNVTDPDLLIAACAGFLVTISTLDVSYGQGHGRTGA